MTFLIDIGLQCEKILPPVLRDRGFIAINLDMKVGDTDNSRIEYIVVSAPGHWKEFPSVGVGIWKYLQGTPSKQAIQREIALQLTNDKFKKPMVNTDKFPIIGINKVTISVNG